MTLLITILAAITVTIIWYKKLPDNNMNLGMLSLMYWGAAMMWMVDAVVEYAEVGVEYFTPPIEDMINDSYLGFSVVALGLAAWLAVLIIKDPKGAVKNALFKKR